MPTANILSHLGLFVRRGFLSAESCRLIRGEMASADRAAAMIRPVGKAGGVVDEATRRTGVAHVSQSTVALVEDPLRATIPALEDHFLVRLAGWQRLQFYIYEEGDFFVVHRDKDDTDPTAPDWVRSRQVSVSILLNDEAAGLDGQAYRGGRWSFMAPEVTGPGPGSRSRSRVRKGCSSPSPPTGITRSDRSRVAAATAS